jgi:hypothetical protein
MPEMLWMVPAVHALSYLFIPKGSRKYFQLYPYSLHVSSLFDASKDVIIDSLLYK